MQSLSQSTGTGAHCRGHATKDCHSQLKLGGNLILMLFLTWHPDHYLFLHMSWQLCCCVLCMISWWAIYWKLDGSKTNFPSNLNCDEKHWLNGPQVERLKNLLEIGFNSEGRGSMTEYITGSEAKQLTFRERQHPRPAEIRKWEHWLSVAISYSDLLPGNCHHATKFQALMWLPQFIFLVQEYHGKFSTLAVHCHFTQQSASCYCASSQQISGQ